LSKTITESISDLQESVGGLVTKTTNLDASEGSDTLYIIAQDDTVIAKVNE